MRRGDVLSGRFVVEERAGSGGMGTVFRALDQRTGLPVAIKLVHVRDEADGARFAHEIELLRDLIHPGIAAYIAHGTHEGSPFVAIEWLEGRDLAARLSEGPIEFDAALGLVHRVARILAFSHARGVVHRDVKPANVFLEGGATERVRLLDFGIATLRHPNQTSSASPVGTPSYMAPEQARGDRDVGAAADVYSLGCVLFECLVGRPPFFGEHAIAVLAKTLLDEAPRVREFEPGVPRSVDRLVARMLAKDPRERPEDGGALERELSAILEEGPTLGSSTPSIAPGREALSSAERTLTFVVLVDGVGHEALRTAPTFSAEGSPPGGAVASPAMVFGARIEPLGPHSIAATLTGLGAPTDEAARAARFALSVRAMLPEASIALVASRDENARRHAVGAALDRGAALLRDAHGSPSVAIDDVAASLLDARFDVRPSPFGFRLFGEQFASLAPRTLLGKATPCIGRDAELRLLRGLFDATVAEPERCAVIVSASAGVGKSRLLKEFLDGITAAEVWIGRGDPASAGAPFGLIAQALRSAAGIVGGEPQSVRQEKLAARVAISVGPSEQRRVTEFLGELTGTPFDATESVLLRTARRDARLLGDQMRCAFEDLVSAELDRGPLVIALEDIHWGDAPSLSLVDAALGAAQDRPLFVVALGRPELEQRFPNLFAERGTHALRLHQLRPRACEHLVRTVLGDSVRDERVGEIVRRSAGNAFTLEELIRAEAEGRGGEPTESVLAMLGTRLMRLDGEARRVLRAASVFGDRFTQEGVAELVGDADPPLAVTLKKLTDAELTAPLEAFGSTGETAFVFRHALVRDASYAMLPDAERIRAHALAGAFLERSGEQDALALAQHFEQGGDRERAVAWYLRSAAKALEGNDLAGAIERARRGLASGASGDDLGALSLVMAEAYRWQGENGEAAAAALRALAALEPHGEFWYAATGEAVVALGKLGRVDDLVRIAHDLDRLAVDEGRLVAVVNARARAASQLLYAGCYEQADAMLEPVAPLAERVRALDPSAHARFELARAIRLLVAGDPSAEARFAEAAADFDAVGDGRSACNARMNRGAALLEVGANAEAEQAFRDVLGQTARLALEQVAAVARLNLGIVLGRRGAFDEARDVERAAVASLAAQGNRRLEGAARSYLAGILANKGELANGEREAREAVSLLAVAPPLRAQARATLARILLDQGRIAEAVVEATRAADELEALGGIEEGAALVRLTLVEALQASGSAQAASQALALAHANLEARAAKITSPELRRTFLEDVPEHARTMALWKKG